MASVTANKQERPKGSVVVFQSASRAIGVHNSSDLKFPNAKRAHIIIDVTDVNSSGTLDVILKGKDPVSGKYYPILTFAQITAASLVVGKVADGMPAVANLAVNDVLPDVFRLEATAAVDAIVFSIGINLIDE